MTLHANNPINYDHVKIAPGFWQDMQDLYREVTIDAVYDRFEESGRFRSLKADWKDGMPFRPHIFWESDVTKWVEGAAYFLKHHPDPELEAKVDAIADDLEAAQRSDGYLNIYFTVVEPGARFTRRTDHELYCAGHLIEGALAYYHTTGKRKLLDVAIRYVDLIDRIFRVEQSAGFDTPGHQEIELALIKLYHETQDEKHLKLAQFFLDKRGTSSKDATYGFADQDHMQSHLPVREQHTAEGHSVRALYMYASMLDLAKETEDQELYDTCLTLFENITKKRMHITGGVGSTHRGESFTYDYDLPEETTYNETCASIALALFCRRLWLMKPEARFADVAEQAIYNTVLSGMSLSGDHFFYENPLAVDPRRQAFNDSRPKGLKEHLPILERVKVFSCSCCPPNLVRFVGAIGDYAYSTAGDTLYTHMYMSGDAQVKLSGGSVSVKQRTDYPYDGAVKLTVGTAAPFKLALRIPGWCRDYDISVNGASETLTADEDGYVYLDRSWQEGDSVSLNLKMPVRFVEANPEVTALAGRVAVMRGPLVYCAEAHDIEDDVRVRDLRLSIEQDEESGLRVTTESVAGVPLPSIRMQATSKVPVNALYYEASHYARNHSLRLIPYFAWANRGVAEMTTWFLKG